MERRRSRRDARGAAREITSGAFMVACVAPLDSEDRWANGIATSFARGGRASSVGPILPRVDGVDPATRRRLADAWTADALEEHASIASFARFILHLLALGAPVELVAQAQRALADEVDHARICFALASAYAGAPVGPAPRSIDALPPDPLDPAMIVLRAVQEGCIGETLAALKSGVAAESAVDPAVTAVLARIAADELEHAAIAWRFVTWALRQGTIEVDGLLAEVIVGVEEAVVEADQPTPAPGESDLRVHGRLGPVEVQALRASGLRTMVLPVLQAVAVAAGARGVRRPFGVI